MSKLTAASILALAAVTFASPVAQSHALEARQNCVGTINSIASVAAAEKCSTINISAFTVPATQKLVINAVSGATINLNGNIVFAADTSFQTAGPIFTLTGDNINFHGNGFTIDGQGDKYWDGKGIADDAPQKKPHPMIKLSCSGLVENLKVLNSPAQVFSMGNDAALRLSKINIDNSAGNKPNTLSGTKPAAHNTDGFDVSTNDVTIEDSTIVNQDDCIAINNGQRITFQRNHCTGGHGISVGSIDTGKVVKTVQIIGNTITNNAQALRIKTFRTAASGSVSDVTYQGNNATGCLDYGVIIDQSYPDTLSNNTGAGVKISGVNFTGTNTIAVASSAKGMAAVNCASGGCTGTWNWSGLKVSGGPKGPVNYGGIINFTQ